MFGMTTRTAIPNCQEFRTQLLARSIRDTLGEGIRLNWVHSGAQLADALMKTHETNGGKCPDGDTPPREVLSS